MGSTDEMLVLGFLCAVGSLKVIGKIMLNDIRLAIRTGIIHDEGDDRKSRLLHCETVHGISDVGGMVEGYATGAHHIFIFLFHYFLILFI